MYIEKIHRERIVELNSTGIFSSSLWLSIYEKSNLIIKGIFNNNKELIGFFYYQNHKRAKLLTHISPPFLSPNCGLFVKDESTNTAKKNSFQKKVHELISTYFKKEKFDILTLPFPFQYADMQPYIWSGFEVSPKYTYQLDLSQNENSLLAAMSPERRKNITKSIKDGLAVKVSLVCEKSQQLIEKTFTNQGLWFDKQVLTNLFLNLTSNNNAISYSTYAGEQLLATVFCVKDDERAYYILGGFDNDSLHSGAGAFAMWHAIKKAKEDGLKIFDFEGSMHPPIEKYFRGFGGEMVPYFCVEKKNLKGKALLKLRGK